MYSPKQLFLRRVKEDWKFQYQVWKMVVEDWIIYVYVVLPFLIFLSYEYITLWHVQPTWFQFFSVPVISLALYLFTLSGTIRYFIEEGDQLFLLQRHHWMQYVKKTGMLYSLVAQGIILLIIFLLLLPLLWVYHKISLVHIAYIFVTTYFFKVNMMLVNQYRTVRYNGWSLYASQAVVWLVGVFIFHLLVNLVVVNDFYVIPISILLIVLAAWIINKKLGEKTHFFHDVEREQKEKYRYAKFLVGGFVQKKRVITRKRPTIFRHSNSNLLFRKRGPVNGLTELHIKTLLRNVSRVMFYLRFVAIVSVPMLIIPVGMKWILWMSAPWLLGFWLKTVGKEVDASSFLELFSWKKQDQLEALRKSTFLLLLPAVVCFSLVLGISLHSVTTIVLLIVIGTVISKLSAAIICLWY